MGPLLCIANTTRNTTLAQKAELANNPLQRLVGLIGKSTLSADAGLVIMPCSGIHTIGMRFAIDALYIDYDNRVLRTVSKLAPWKVAPVDSRASYIIELAAGVIEQTGTQIGDKVAVSSM